MKKEFFSNKKAIGLTISFVVHAALFYELYHARIRVKIFDFPSSRIRNVVIAPPVRFRVPNPSEPTLTEHGIEGSGGTDVSGGKQGVKEPSGEIPGERRGRPETKGGTVSGVVPQNLLKGAPGSETPVNKESSLALGTQYGEEGDGKLRINLAKIPGNFEDTIFEKPRRPSGRFPVIGNPGSRFAGRGGRTGGSGTGGAPGIGGQRATAKFESPGYDISPWAQKAMSSIQFKWKIPHTRVLFGDDVVKIAVTIERDGTFSSFEIVGKTEIDVFNLSAVNALRLSAPLPELPGDFPAQNLKALFVFAYHD